jgi:hypothetical protein
MTTKCTGLMGRIFGHKWKEGQVVAPAEKYGPGIFFMHGEGPFQILKEIKCQRCGAVTGEKK